MKVIIVIVAFMAIAKAAPQYNTPPRYIVGDNSPRYVVPNHSSQNPSANAVIVRYDSDNIGIDGFRYQVETSDGQSKQEEGQLVNVGTDNEGIAVRGQYSYTGPDGVVYTVNYIADENGFQPQGAHIPTAP